MPQTSRAQGGGRLKKSLALLRQQIQTWIGALKIEPRSRGWEILAEITLLAGFGLVFMEWLFLVTKPSFMDTLTFGPRLVVLFTASILAAALFVLPVGGLWLASRMKWSPRSENGWFQAAAAVPALILAGLLLLMLDNFTYTVLHFGIVTSERALRGVYALLFLAMLYLSYRQVGRWIRALEPRPHRRLRMLVAGLVLVGIITAVKFSFSKTSSAAVLNTGTIGQRPNILLIGSDGLSADHMSLYGYALDTTPNLTRLAADSLWAENAFSNSSNTSGSLISLLSSKPPTATRVLYPPDILSGINAFQHLPGLLHNAGYTTVQLSTAYYADAFALNVQNGFDLVNGQESVEHSQLFQAIRPLLPGDVAYFLSSLSDRLVDRLLHIYFIRAMPNPYQTVTTGAVETTDRQRVDQIIRLVTSTNQPVFIHAHLMGTHGPRYEEIVDPVFSSGLAQDEEWLDPFYDDSILTFDRLIAEIVAALEDSGQLDNTILVIYSDHARFWRPDQRVPLLIHFPDNAHAGAITANVQNLDVVPTLLYYMDWEIPTWMEGQSLIASTPATERIIFNAAVAPQGVAEQDGYFALIPERLQPPFYQFGNIRAIVCDRYYDLNLEDHSWMVRHIPGHTAPCTEATALTSTDIKAAILQHLQDHGFDVATLETLAPPPAVSP